MPSFFGHVGVGLITASYKGYLPKSERLWSLWLIFVAISPDFTYFFVWILGSATFSYYFHSIGFVFVIALFSSIVLYFRRDLSLKRKSIQVFAAGGSHLLLDYFVGVIPKPLLWPFAEGSIRFTYGFLPSAGKLDISNYFFYRNLLLELAILLPPAIFYLLIKRNVSRKHILIYIFLIAIPWYLAISFSFSLFRG